MSGHGSARCVWRPLCSRCASLRNAHHRRLALVGVCGDGGMRPFCMPRRRLSQCSPVGRTASLSGLPAESMTAAGPPFTSMSWILASAGTLSATPANHLAVFVAPWIGRRGARLAAAVRPHRHIRRQHFHQRIQIAAECGPHESLGRLPAQPPVGLETRTARLDVAASSMCHLADRLFARAIVSCIQEAFGGHLPEP